jgi:hypothetical protein
MSRDCLGIKPTVAYDETANKGSGAWRAHWEEKPWVVCTVFCKTEEEAWRTVRGELPEQMSADEAVARITDKMAKAAREAVEQ